VECWSARELQHLLGYSKWENFAKVIDKAKESCVNAPIQSEGFLEGSSTDDRLAHLGKENGDTPADKEFYCTF
jgi:DNA-damage-inducible protein D